MSHFIKLLGALSLACAAPALADPVMECSRDTQTQVEISRCLEDTEARSEYAMNSAFGFANESAKELDRVTGREVSARALAASQSAWESHRRAFCNFVGTSLGGGGGTSIALQKCRIEMARERQRQLMKYAQ